MTNKSNKKAEREALVLQKVKNKTFSQRQAADILRLSLRQIKRKIKVFKKDGPEGLIHKNCKKKSNRSIDPSLKNEVIEFLNRLIAVVGNCAPTYTLEKLKSSTTLSISCETLRKIMIENGFWKQRKRKEKRRYWRQRKLCMGQMIQVDGSKHIWFGDQYYTLLAFIDDATSKIMHAEFCKEETVKSLSKATIHYLKKHGKPLSLYVDRGKVFKVNNTKQKRITQYHRMLTELGIELIFAYSPQAKGRIERLFRTLQDRLVKDLKYANITTIEQANMFLASYIDIHNSKFAEKPSESVNLHEPIEEFNLDTIFCIKKSRIMADDSTISFKGRFFLILKEQSIRLKRYEEITICEHFDGTISLYARFHRLNWREIYEREKIEPIKKEKKAINSTYKPPNTHPWRRLDLNDKLPIHKR